ncbi:hypothetical protein DH2020_009812 [Rehmannia glutinosa]|uniref:Uncharacterized protein n=1 Tax=Rehmannia glutinosa TaxID=99300 RepID=A0ABR0X9N6_REHGL
MENANGASYYEKMDGLARWVGMSVAAAFFASLERCSCVNLTTFDTDDDEEGEAKDRPLMLTSFGSMNSTSSSSFAANHNVNVNNPPPAVENLPVVRVVGCLISVIERYSALRRIVSCQLLTVHG